MKYLKPLLRVATLLVIVVLGFTAVFPEWFDFAAILKQEYETNKVDKDAIKLSKADHLGTRTQKCGSIPVIRVARDYDTGSESMPPTQTLDDAAKVFINRDPEVFDLVCEGDTLKFNVYAENVDELSVTYEDIDSEMMSYETRNPAIFRNAMEFTVPTDWSGPAQIEASGFVSGWAGVATNKVTFDVKRRTAEKPLENSTISPLENRVNVQRPNQTGMSELKVVKIIDGHKIQIGSDVKSPENWMIELDVDNLKANTRIELDNTNARVTVKQLSARKLYEDKAKISHIKGVLLAGKLSEQGLLIQFNFTASNKPLSPPGQGINDVERYWVQGRATVIGTQ